MLKTCLVKDSSQKCTSIGTKQKKYFIESIVQQIENIMINSMSLNLFIDYSTSRQFKNIFFDSFDEYRDKQNYRDIN